jgi:cardiolipin synthase (CMP-forming)
MVKQSGSPDRIATIPNAITLVRALGIPAFLFIYLHSHRPLLSFFILVIGALTDYFDGKVARALGQESTLGAALDPAIDRAYIAATVFALAIESVIPWWLLAILVARDLWLAVILYFYRRRTGLLFQVTYLGKAATFNLLYAFPFLLLAGERGFSRLCGVMGWAFVIWGVGLYLLTGIQYSVTGLVRGGRN